MTSTDLLSSMPASPAAATQVSRSGGTGSQSGGSTGDEQAAFPNVLRKLAKGSEKDASTAAQEQASAGRPKESALARLRRLEAEKAGVRKSDQDHARAGEAADADADNETTPSGGDDLMALLQAASAGLHNPSRHNAQAQGTAADAKSSPASGDAAQAGANAVGDVEQAGEIVRGVKVVSVKVETHHVAATGPAGAADFARELNAAKLGQAGEKRAEPASGRTATGPATADGTLDPASQTGAAAPAHGRHAGAATADERSFGSGHRQGGSADTPAGGARSVDATAATAGGATAGTLTGQLQSPVQQVGSRLLAVADEMRQTAASAAADAGTSAPSAGPVRVLSINLHPEDLGSVTVRMAMVGDALDVQIAAEQPDTARMLQSDSSQLTDMLRTAGVQVDGVTIRAASPDGVSGSAGSGQSFMDQQAQGQQGNAQSDARASNGNSRQQERQTYEGGSRARNEEEAGWRTAAGGGLYV